MNRKQDNSYTRHNRPTILIVEDDLAIGEMLMDLITWETPYQAFLASTGAQALKLVSTMTPCLFLLDYILPDMNGIEIYDQLHALSRLRHVPALMVSANYPQAEVNNRHIIGIRKPFELNDILAAIQRVINQAHENDDHLVVRNFTSVTYR